MSLCESIDTLAMAYLDDELAPEERRELETHLTECTSCRGEIDGARADQSLIQGSLVAPRATDTMRMRLLRSFDEADRETARAERKRMSSWLLPGGAIAAAAAAILVFVGVGMQQPQREHGSIAHVRSRP
jgi:anti-sigma factor RsiW